MVTFLYLRWIYMKSQRMKQMRIRYPHSEGCYMNKRMIALIVLVAAAFVIPSSAETVEIRGAVAQVDSTQSFAIAWDAYNFAAFRYDPYEDLRTETMTIAVDTLIGPDIDRIIDKNCLTYQTTLIYREYELYENEGLAVGGDAGYYLLWWRGCEYVALNGSADKTCELVIELEEDERKLLGTGETWEMGRGFTLTAQQIDLEGDKVWFSLSKDGIVLDEWIVSAGEAYTYTEDICGVNDVPVFSCYVDALFRGVDRNVVQIKYVFLIDNDALVITPGDQYGSIEVMAAGRFGVTLGNHDPIDLDPGSTREIMGDTCFKVADDDTTIRFYPFVEYGGTAPYRIRGMVQNLAGAQPADRVWNAYNFAALWYDLDGDLMTETLTIDANTLTGPDIDRTIDEDRLTYQTAPVYLEYELYENEGLTVGGDAGYYLEGWVGDAYVAIGGSADKICKLLVELEDDERKLLGTGEAWDMGGGFALIAQQIDLEGDKVWFSLSKDEKELDNQVVSVGEAYTYTEDICGVNDVPVFSCYVDTLFRGVDRNLVQIKYVFLIDNCVREIGTGDDYDAMEVITAGHSQVILRNRDPIDLSDPAGDKIMDDMYFMTADSTIIRFCPFIERSASDDAPDPGPDPTPTLTIS
uniref:Major S-layer protein n=1 Tax=Candidatus Methanogaster sp. ANME-2c ERB4 TaxID=2759911 RepID=A0A7G9YGG8_9EURY|nr:major S-layer protein [Methanosarcinales archaeon ANME-2c ERB4]